MYWEMKIDPGTGMLTDIVSLRHLHLGGFNVAVAHGQCYLPVLEVGLEVSSYVNG